MSIILDIYEREVLNSGGDNMNKQLLNLRLFDGAEGGDANQGTNAEQGTTVTPEATPSTPPQAGGSNGAQSEDVGFLAQLRTYVNSLGASGQGEENKPPVTDKPNEDNGSSNDMSAVEERIAGIERRETIADLRDAGVTPEQMDDAMTLFTASGEKDVNKFLESRPYLKGVQSGQTEAVQKPEDKPVSKKNLSTKEQYLRTQGYLK